MEGEWRAIFDNQSGQFYFWNIKTGETTWERPCAFTEEHFAETHLPKSGTLEAQDNQCVHSDKLLGENNEQQSEPGVPGLEEAPPMSVPTATSLPVSHDDAHTLRNGSLFDQSLIGDMEGRPQNSSVDKIEHGENLGVTGHKIIGDSDQSPQTKSGENHVNIKDDTGEQFSQATEEPKEDIKITDSKEETSEQAPDPLQLLSWSERLYQRFKELEGAGDAGRGPSLRSKYAWEAEIRLADCKALLSNTVNLEPFWVHTASQLKRLESVLSVEEAAISSVAEQGRLLQNRHLSATPYSIFRNRIRNNLKDKARVENEQTVPNEKTIDHPAVTDVLSCKVEEKSSDDDERRAPEEHESLINSPVNAISHDDANHKEGIECFPETAKEIIVDSLEEENHKEENYLYTEKNSDNAQDACEDVDMEVDMDVDEQTEPHPSNKEESLSTVAVDTHNTPPHSPAVECNMGDIPQQPQGGDGESIPPPPPDGESLPPPPPDEPPPSPSLPAESSTAYEEQLFPVLPYTEQYTAAYVPMASYSYYPTGNDASMPNYYVPTVQTDSVPLGYYEQTANAYTDPSCFPSPAEGIAYYNSGSGAISGTNYAPSFYGTTGVSMYAGNSTASNLSGLGMPAVSCGNAGTATSSDSTGVAASSSSQVLHSVSTSSTSSAVVGNSTRDGASEGISKGYDVRVTTATQKNQNKVVRSKKRSVAGASTLRSNKKVSSLVDKWKAAKEELHGSDSEDEDMSAVQYLEKKRQREIEEWRMQQIASGEAKDNANFQPLGGDWREKVKRKELEAAASDNQSQTSLDISVSKGSESKKPDLAELSKGLPAGWQAFWDESSGDVYYGNLTTSETTWDRPK
eukprot:TRINITY_DN2761_c0_g1_i7.p1 TRINITY_DN2761_c0_g1~~TRINITY_DN2761_c0_g1_i7.p1  ORF type:complete len:980 (+),score=279.61 TRINITY_DN2761_c0_g1_i7:376-2940(+)